jgi:hypothetical protein
MTSIVSIFKLKPVERQYLEILKAKKTSEWSAIDSLMAQQMARELALVEELSTSNDHDQLIADACKRIYEGSRQLELVRIITEGARQRLRIVEEIVCAP